MKKLLLILALLLPLTSSAATTIPWTQASLTDTFFTPGLVNGIVLGIQVNGASSTLQNFTFVNATGSSATTTNFFSTTASSSKLFTANFQGANLSTCTGNNALTWSAGLFGCAAQTQGTVTSVTGTSNRITSTGGATPVIDISGSYVGQASITTVGTLSSGAVPASLVTAGTFGAGSYVFPSALTVTGNTTLAQATSTNFAISSIATGNCLHTTTGGAIVGTGSDCGSGGGTSIGGTITSGTAGSVLYVNPTATIAQDNSNFFYNGLTHALGLGLTNGTARLEIKASSTASTDQALIAWDSSSNPLFYVRNDGNVGIGNSAPQALLHVGAGVGALVGTNIKSVVNTAGATGFAVHNSTAGNETALFAGASGDGSVGATTNNPFNLLINNVKTATLNITGGFGVGTTTPMWSLEGASSTRPQLALDDGSLTSNHWTFRNAGGILYVATSSPSTFATSTTAALTIDTNGKVIANCFSNDGSTCITSGGGTNFLTNVAGNVFLNTGTNLQAPNLDASSTGAITFLTRSKITSSADGLLTFSNNATTDFTRLNFGGTTSVFPAFTKMTGRGGPGVAVTLADGTNGGVFGVGTSSPIYVAEFSSTTAPQLSLDNQNGGTDAKHLILNYTGTSLLVGTSSDTTTSTSTAMSITPGVTSQLGIGTTSPWRTLSVVGTVGFTGLSTAAGTLTGGGYLCLTSTNEVVNDSSTCLISSKRFKHDIEPLNVGLDTLMKLRPVSFVYNTTGNPQLDARGPQEGFIAEDVAALDPRLVEIDPSGQPYTVRYENMVAMVTKSIQELNQKIILGTRSAEDHKQNIEIGLLAAAFGLYVVYNEWDKRRK